LAYRHTGAFEARDSQAGKPSLRIGIEAKPCPEFRAEELRLLILEPSVGAIATTMAATNKRLAKSTKSRTAAKATKKR
jgi:hypothetical protein